MSMHLIFERSKGPFRSNCNILALEWMPYYNEIKFRQALFEYLTSNDRLPHLGSHQERPDLPDVVRTARPLFDPSAPGGPRQVPFSPSNHEPRGTRSLRFAQPPNIDLSNSRLVELYQRHSLNGNANACSNPNSRSNKRHRKSLEQMSHELDRRYGKMADFGWLAIGNIGKIVGISLTSTVPPPQCEVPRPVGPSVDLMQFQDSTISRMDQNDITADQHKSQVCQSQDDEYRLTRPDRPQMRQNYNLRGHMDEIILVRWNDLYQKLATVDSKGNVLIWYKVKEKFTIQTPFYNRTKSVADFQWSNDGKTALICYTDSFILVGSSSARHWHSMLNLEDYHVTCASWEPNDERLLLGVSNGNVVLIDLPQCELTELAVGLTNIRAMSWSSSLASLSDLSKANSKCQNHLNPKPAQDLEHEICQSEPKDPSKSPKARIYTTTVVNHRRLTGDPSYFYRNRFCSQGPNSNRSQQKSVSGCPGVLRQKRPAHPETFGEADANILAIDYANNTIELFVGGLEDPIPKCIQVGLESYVMRWSANGKLLAVAGFNIHTSAPSVGCIRCRYLNTLKFYDLKGQLVHEQMVQHTRYPITALTWAHGDSRIFVSTGPILHCAHVHLGIAKLNLLAMSCIHRNTRQATKNDILRAILNEGLYSLQYLSWQSFNCPIKINLTKPMVATSSTSTCKQSLEYPENESTDPPKHINNINNFKLPRTPAKLHRLIDSQVSERTLKGPFDEHWCIEDIVWHVPKANGQRNYCTLVCYTNDRKLGSLAQYQYRQNWSDRLLNEDSYATDCYKIFVLYVEHQGCYIPILRARRVGFLKPEFVIFDPKVSETDSQKTGLNSSQRQVCKVSDLEPSSQRSRNSSAAGMVSQDNCSQLHEQQYCNSRSYSLSRQNSSKMMSREKMAELISHRSNYQEPPAMPVNNNNYMTYMMQRKLNQQGNSSPSPSLAHMSMAQRMTKDDLESFGQPSTSKTHHNFDHRRPTKSDLIANLNERVPLFRIKSNIWGTQFKVINAKNRMIRQRCVLGTIGYKTSILHLQPRQIDLTVKDMSNYCCLCSRHHHSRQTSQGISNHHSDFEYSNSKSKHPKLNPINQVSLIDLPNHELAKVTSRSTRRRRSSTKTPTNSSLSDKVLINVGDNVRIAPRLDAHQRYKLVQTNSQPSTRASTSGSHKPGSSNARNGDDFRSSTRSRQREFRRDHIPARSASITTTYNPSPANDAILTLSLGQGDQLTVNMQSLSSQSPNMIVQGRSMTSPEPITGQRRPMLNEDDKFLLENRTLKSIQSITKMIVDLSSKASEDDDVGDRDNRDQSSPSKMMRLDNGTSDDDKDHDDDDKDHPNRRLSPQLSSRNFWPPDTPIHRPRQMVEGTSQSACSTPMRRPLRVSRQSQRERPKGSRHAKRDDNHHYYQQQQQPLPPPPPSAGLRRRLSASAKRIYDGSVRSLCELSGRSVSNSDAESEDSEPLVSSLNQRLARRINHRSMSVGPPASQPTSPLRRHREGHHRTSSSTDKSSQESSSLREKLIHRMHNTMISSSSTTTSTTMEHHKHRAGRDRESRRRAPNSPEKRLRSSSAPRQSLVGRLGALRNSSSRMPNYVDSDYYDELELASSDSEDIESDNRLIRLSSDSSLSSRGDEQDYDDYEDDYDDDEEDDNDMNMSSTTFQRAIKNNRHDTSKRSLFKGSSKRLRSLWSSALDLREPGPPMGQLEPEVNERSRNRQQFDELDRNASTAEVLKQQKLMRKSICNRLSCCCAREIKLKNVAPTWNDTSQVYQLDFGGRVTQESAKNLQIDFQGKVALQFGRVDRCTYTLDYEYPFNAVQAMAVALASLTQRMK